MLDKKSFNILTQLGETGEPTSNPGKGDAYSNKQPPTSTAPRSADLQQSS